jgi:hypothetical protein
MDKRCTKCQETKDEDDFEMRSDRPGKRRSHCRVCVNESHRDSYSHNAQRAGCINKMCPKCGETFSSPSYQAYCSFCKESTDNDPAYYQANRQKALDNWLYSRYGLTVSDYEGILASQNNGCAICGGTETPLDQTGVYRRMPVDHDHPTGKTRGILCHPCNTSLGNMHDNPALLRKAADYLEGWSRNG